MKSIKIYDAMSEKDQMNWLTRTQASDSVSGVLASSDMLIHLDKNKKVRKKHFAVQSDEYSNHLMVGKGEFYLSKYSIELMYNYEDIVKEYKDFELELMVTEVKHVENKRLEISNDLRTLLNDRRSLQSEDKFKPVVFYGDEKEAIVHESTQFRLYYMVLLNYPFIMKMYSVLHGISEVTMNALMFLYARKYFERNDIFQFHRNNVGAYASHGSWTKSYSQLWIYMNKNGYVERVERGEKSLTRKNGYTGKLYRTTTKTDQMCELLIEYLMYKKKMPYGGKSLTGHRPAYSDYKTNANIKRDSYDMYFDKNPYSFYEFMFEYVNQVAEVEMFEGSLKEWELKMTSQDLKFNPLIFRIGQRRNFFGTSRHNKYIETYLEGHRWGHKV